MHFKRIVVLAVFAIGSGANAQTFSEKELSLIGYKKNPAISAFLNKQGFPSSVDKEGAAKFAEKQGLLRDGRLYGSRENTCKAQEFYYVDVMETFVEIGKIITPDTRESRVELTKGEHQAEWDRIFGKLGNPSQKRVSREIWPNNNAGMIQEATYTVNHNGWPVWITFRLWGMCLKAYARYSPESSTRSYIDKAKEETRPKASAADGL